MAARPWRWQAVLLFSHFCCADKLGFTEHSDIPCFQWTTYWKIQRREQGYTSQQCPEPFHRESSALQCLGTNNTKPWRNSAKRTCSWQTQWCWNYKISGSTSEFSHLCFVGFDFQDTLVMLMVFRVVHILSDHWNRTSCLYHFRFSNLRFVNKAELLKADLPLLPSEFEALVKQQCWDAHEVLRKT